MMVDDYELLICTSAGIRVWRDHAHGVDHVLIPDDASDAEMTAFERIIAHGHAPQPLARPVDYVVDLLISDASRFVNEAFSRDASTSPATRKAAA